MFIQDQLATTSIELLIVAFPELEIVDGESEEEENKRWIKYFLVSCLAHKFCQFREWFFD